MNPTSMLSFLNNAHYQVYYTPLAKALGSINAAILLSELIQRYEYHKNRNELQTINQECEWFYHTSASIEERLALTRREQDTAIKILKEFGILETKLHGIPAKRFFKIFPNKIHELLYPSKNVSSLYKSAKLELLNPPDKALQKSQTAPYIEEPNKDPNEKDIPNLSVRLSLFFLDKLKTINPKLKSVSSSKWAKDFELMIEKDGHTEEEIRKVIEYLISTKSKPSANGFCWANVVLSSQSLRNNFAKLWAEMSWIKNISGDQNLDEEMSKEIYKKFSQRNDICLGYNYIEFINGMTVAHIQFGDKNFKELVLNELKKRNLSL